MSAAAANPKSQAPEQKARRRAWPWIPAIVVLAAAGAGGWWWWQDRQAAAEDAADARPRQLSLFPGPDDDADRNEALDEAVDALRQRFGAAILRRGRW